MCVATVLLETGIRPMNEPVNKLTIEAPRGLLRVVAICNNGKVRLVSITNVASFADKLSVELSVPGFGKIIVDTALAILGLLR